MLLQKDIVGQFGLKIGDIFRVPVIPQYVCLPNDDIKIEDAKAASYRITGISGDYYTADLIKD